MTFNLPAPPGFRGLDPDLPVEVYVRNLPHWRQEGATYFVTFHLSDALPKNKQNELAAIRREWEKHNDIISQDCDFVEWAKKAFQFVETCADAGYGRCWFRNSDYAAVLRSAILKYHEIRYEIGCFVIMVNHCHLAIRPLEEFRLETEIGAIKSIASLAVNESESRIGSLWQEEAYDRIIRDEEHLWRVVRYVGSNPCRAGIPREHWNRWINPKWQPLGWDFQDD